MSDMVLVFAKDHREASEWIAQVSAETVDVHYVHVSRDDHMYGWKVGEVEVVRVGRWWLAPIDHREREVLERRVIAAKAARLARQFTRREARRIRRMLKEEYELWGNTAAAEIGTTERLSGDFVHRPTGDVDRG